MPEGKMVMAKVTISQWTPGEYPTTKDTPGAIKLLALYSNLGQQDAKNLIAKIKDGQPQTVDVMFTKLSEFKRLLAKQGYTST